MKGSSSDEVPRTRERSASTVGFFAGIRQFEVPWRDRSVCTPTFYYDIRQIQAQFLVPLKAVTALLPSRNLHPVRVTPWHTAVVITAWEHRDTDIEPYNELAIGIPVSLAGPVRPFTGLLWPAPVELDFFLLHLPVTTELARDVGIQYADYPKFLANIEFTEDSDWVTCRMSEQGQHIVTLSVRKGALRPAPRLHVRPINFGTNWLLRSTFVISEHQESTSKNQGDARLELGDHPVGRQLRDLPVGRLASCNYIPQAQAVLTYAAESYAA